MFNDTHYISYYICYYLKLNPRATGHRWQTFGQTCAHLFSGFLRPLCLLDNQEIVVDLGENFGDWRWKEYMKNVFTQRYFF